MKKIISCFLILLVIVSCFLFGKKEEKIEENIFIIPVKEISKRGNVILDTSYEELKEKNIDLADIVTISFSDISIDVPFVCNYSDVDMSDNLLRYDKEDNKIDIAINGSNFANKYEFAIQKQIEEDPGYSWEINYDSISISLKEKEGYIEQYTIRNLERTNNREDYPELNDRQFANYRSVNTTGIKENTLYRGTTPISDALARNDYAMSFLKEDGIKTILNLTNSTNEMEDISSSDKYRDSYYLTCNIHLAEMEYDYSSDNFKQKVKGCVEFINTNDGPYYIHCKEGKDRTGFLCAILECYMGATYQEVIEDYMETFINFYKLEKDGETYNITIINNIDKILSDAFEVSNLKEASLVDEAKEYLTSAGLQESDLETLKIKLGY